MAAFHFHDGSKPPHPSFNSGAAAAVIRAAADPAVGAPKDLD